MNKEIINMNSNFEDIIETNEIPRKTESDNEEMHNEISIISNNDSKRNYYNHLNKSKSKNEEPEKNSINENNQNDSIGQISNSKNISSIINNENNKSSEIKKPKN
jgi:hypothetical protein